MPNRTIACLAAVIFALSVHPPSARAQTDRELVDRYDRAVAAQRYHAALDAARKICDRHPDAAWWRFKLGAMHARLGNDADALGALDASLDNGFTGVRSFEQSEHLGTIRDDPRFAALLDRVRDAARERLERYAADAQRHTPEVHVPQTAPQSPGLILALHGTGMRGRDMIAPLRAAADKLGLVLVAPDALRRSGGGYAWTYRDESEWMIDRMIDWAHEHHDIDRERVFLVGFSQGANIALAVAQTRPERFAGIIPICGHYDGPIHDDPVQDNDEQVSGAVPVYLLTGARDPWSRTNRLAARDFKDRGTPVRVEIRRGQGHEIPTGAGGERAILAALKWCDARSPSVPDQDDG